MISVYEYRVPFSTREEKKLAFNLTAGELLTLATGGVLGLMAAGMVAAVFDVPFLFCVPAAIPFVGAAAYLAFKKIKKVDAVMTYGVYLYRKILFHRSPKHYILFRK